MLQNCVVLEHVYNFRDARKPNAAVAEGKVDQGSVKHESTGKICHCASRWDGLWRVNAQTCERSSMAERQVLVES